MKVTVYTFAILLACPPTLQAQTFQSHSEFFGYVSKAEAFQPAFERRELGQATPVDKDVGVAGLSARWGRVRLARDAIVLRGKRFPLAQVKTAWGHATAASIDIETAEVWEESAPQPRLCVESSSGHSGSAARWRHVFVVEGVAKKSRPRIQRWTTPYGSCEAMWTRQDGQLVAGSFEMSFTSERDISAAAFILRRLSDKQELGRYSLNLVDQANPFLFSATRRP